MQLTSPGGEPIAIRTDLRAGDIGRITAMHGLLYATEYGWDCTFEAYVGEHLSRFALSYGGADECLWIAERVADQETAELVGCIAIVGAEPFVAQLRWFLVHPSARGHGLGRELITLAVEFARAAGYSRIVLDTVSDLTAAAHLYSGAGFCLAAESRTAGWGSEVTEQRYELEL